MGLGCPGGHASQWPCLGTPAQTWSYDGMRRLRNQATGMCLAIAHGETTLGKFAIQWPCKTTGEQRWPFG
ncbi:RICIN domain-containing protein [Nonomuraea sp. CA-143628]|uniref:RICIN domain-containing protein n=1 Tax=Nonomuraea sp. CA-143628 TaxID=3239997 RepID=UPI003D902B37